MRNLMNVGVAVVILGVAVVLFGHFSYTETEPVLDAGPIHVTSQVERYVTIPLIVGVVIMLAGVGLIVAGRRAA